MSDSTKETVCVDSDAKSFILFSSETNKLGGKYIKSVEGIEKLSKIEEAEIYGLYIDLSKNRKLKRIDYTAHLGVIPKLI
ncbi:MAG: hypothetical protein K6A43_11620 [Treponema sp.]|nr:hypothetical protein [Treponema sp.]